MDNIKQTNEMGTKPVSRLMIAMGAPMIISMMVQALYNIVDSAFVSNIPKTGELALNALTLAFPIQMLMVAIAIGTGVGTNAMASKSLGRGDNEKASMVVGNSIFLGIVSMCVFIIFGLFGVPAFVKTQTVNPQIIEMATIYLRICCIISIGIVFFAIYEKTLQATGRAKYSTIAQIAGAVTNIVLDPILIYGLLGIPAMDVAGAAIATVIGQIVSAVLAFIFHLKKNVEIKNSSSYLKPKGQIIKGIYSIGLPAIIAQALISVMTYGFNIILVRIDEAAVTAYGLYYKIQQFLLFAAFGLRDAITPIVSFAHGMKNKGRIKDGIKYGLLYTCIVMVAGTILFELIAVPLSSAFGLSGETQKLCISAIRVISVSMLFAGANVAFQGVFQALDSGKESLVISLLRQLILVLPVAYAFSFLAMKDISNIWIVWSTFIIAEVISAAVAILFLKRINKKIISLL